MTGHTHASVQSSGARYVNRLWITFGLVVVFMIVEVVGGLWTGSLALLSDAGHMATDALGLGMALAAILAAAKASRGDRRTFGLYRLEILAALGNAILLFAVALYVLYEAVKRFEDPPEVLSGPMLIVAVLGLIVNVIGWFMLREGAAESLNLEGAFLEVIADLIGSIGVIVAAVVIQLTGWVYIDAIIGAGIGLFILPRAYQLGRKSIKVLIQEAPSGIDLGEVERRLGQIEGVRGVHDLHIWTLSSGMLVATVHLDVESDADRDVVMAEARTILRDEYSVNHATMQVEAESQDCTDLTW